MKWLLVLFVFFQAISGVMAQDYNVPFNPRARFDLLNDETFNPTGYKLTGWTEVQGGGQVVDEDETATCPSGTGFDGQCLEETCSQNNRATAAYHTFAAGAQSGPIYCRAYFSLTDSTGIDASEAPLMAAIGITGSGPDVSSSSLRMYFFNNAGTLQIRGNCGGTVFGATNISTSTIYLLEWFTSQSGDTCDFKLDGVAKGPQSGTLTNNPTMVAIGTYAGAWQPDMRWDNVACDTRGWIGGL